MGFNFIAADRGQVLLLPPDMRDWLPADHLVWFVIDMVDLPAGKVFVGVVAHRDHEIVSANDIAHMRRARPAQTQPVPVRGLGRRLELIDSAGGSRNHERCGSRVR